LRYFFAADRKRQRREENDLIQEDKTAATLPSG
jgi:hypothetical protein